MVKTALKIGIKQSNESMEQSAAGNQDDITHTRTVLWPPAEN